MFKLKYKGQEIGLDKDCRIEWDSVKTNSTDAPTGWCASHEEIDRFVIAEYMIKFKKESAGHPDYMKIVGAEMDKEYNVFEFIDEILKKHPKDYGRINIDDKISYKYKAGCLTGHLYLKTCLIVSSRKWKVCQVITIPTTS